MVKINLNSKVREEFSTAGKHHFFGYYDKSPWNKNQEFLVCLKTDLVNRLATPGAAADIVLIDWNKKETKEITQTHAWNFQQGAMAQWLGPDFTQKIIFNDFRNGEFVSVILGVKSGEEKIISFPIYAIHPNGQMALSLNFSRLDHVREGYGYKKESPTALESEDKDGIFLVDLRNGNKKLIISLADLIKNEKIGAMEEGRHWVDHIALNPSGDRFAFFHRFELKNGGMYTRLYTANLDGSGLYLLLDSGMASHFFWKNDKEILIWARPQSSRAKIQKYKVLRKLIVPIYHFLFKSSNKLKQRISGDSYLLLKDQTKFFDKIGEGILTEDGHASFSPDRKWILTDTYADKNHMRHLYLFNSKTANLVEIGSFYTLPDNSQILDWDSSNVRADLHPRWSEDGKMVCIDSVHSGSRQLHVFDISKLISDEQI